MRDTERDRDDRDGEGGRDGDRQRMDRQTDRQLGERETYWQTFKGKKLLDCELQESRSMANTHTVDPRHRATAQLQCDTGNSTCYTLVGVPSSDSCYAPFHRRAHASTSPEQHYAAPQMNVPLTLGSLGQEQEAGCRILRG